MVVERPDQVFNLDERQAMALALRDKNSNLKLMLEARFPWLTEIPLNEY